AADKDAWADLYLVALTQAGLLRPEDEPPAARESSQVVSLMSVLASGILAGPAGNQFITTGDLTSFFADVRRWYGNNASATGSNAPPPADTLNLQESARTVTSAFNIYVPYSNRISKCELDQI